MKVFAYGKFENLEIGQKVLVARCGSGRSYFGEFAFFERKTKQHLVFITESGSVVKTNENLNTVGKASKAGYFVSLRIEGRENDKEFMKQRVHYWNDKKAVMEYK